MQKAFDDVFKLIKLSFPEEEYRSYENQKKLLSNPNYFIFSKFDETNNLIGIICFWRLKNLTFIEHFAINPSKRGKGIGSKMLKDFISRETVLPIILEVETPKTEISLKRINFYKRTGFKLNKYKYFQMPLREYSLPIEMYLMSYPTELTLETFEKSKSVIYKEVYSI